MDELLVSLKGAEKALHEPHTRRDRSKVDALLHEPFLEFGRSGRCWDRAEMLEYLATDRSDSRVVSQDFAVTQLGPTVALLTYRSARVDDTGTASKFTRRSSVWLQTHDGWKLRFHQGTPTEPFEILAGDR